MMNSLQKKWNDAYIKHRLKWVVELPSSVVYFFENATIVRSYVHESELLMPRYIIVLKVDDVLYKIREHSTSDYISFSYSVSFHHESDVFSGRTLADFFQLNFEQQELIQLFFKEFNLKKMVLSQNKKQE